jgi:hypothetical protein
VIDGVSVVAYNRDSHTGRRRQPGMAAYPATPHVLKPARQSGSKHFVLTFCAAYTCDSILRMCLSRRRVRPRPPTQSAWVRWVVLYSVL